MPVKRLGALGTFSLKRKGTRIRLVVIMGAEKLSTCGITIKCATVGVAPPRLVYWL